ncbi:MAG TPA: thioesterase family protein [Burkholderiaceae bacterium]
MNVASSIFEPEFVEKLRLMFEERISFNRLLGLRIASLEADTVTGEIAMRPELIGHYAHQRLHGGVISAMLDAMGGLAVMAAIGSRHLADPVDDRLARFGKLGTIDLRVDYLRPATGARFQARGTVLRLGSRVASTRMEFMDAHGKVLSTGAAAYMVA